MSAYYNEIEPYAAQWLRNLIAKGMIADGEVDTRSIVDVQPVDLRGFTQCHFFAGIGGWSHALRLAEWPDDRSVWTGSCPCQPFSVAGKGAGTDDPRHLWPHFHRLIAACRPPVVMGEQVAGKAGYGWFDGVRSDLEGIGYSSRAVDIPALAVNAPHIRQRLYWVATDLENADCWHGKCGQVGQPIEICSTESGAGSDNYVSGRRSLINMADADQGGRGRRPRDGDGERDGQARGRHEGHRQPAGGGEDRLDVAHPGDDRTRRDVGAIGDGGWSTLDAGAESLRQTNGQGSAGGSDARSVSDGSFWSDAIWLTGSDGKSRRVEPSIPLLAYGVSNRVGRLRAYGNAIVPPLAAEVIKAFMETEA